MTGHGPRRQEKGGEASREARRRRADRWRRGARGRRVWSTARPRRRASPNGSPRSAKRAAGKALKQLIARRPRSRRCCWGSPTDRPISGNWRSRAGPSAAHPRGRSRRTLRRAAGEIRQGRGSRQGRSRGDAAPAPDEGRGGAADRAGRHRRRLAGDAGGAGADRGGRHRGRRGRALFLLRDAGVARQAQARRQGRRRSKAAATSCSPWARWARSSSTIPATST